MNDQNENPLPAQAATVSRPDMDDGQAVGEIINHQPSRERVS